MLADPRPERDSDQHDRQGDSAERCGADDEITTA